MLTHRSRRRRCRRALHVLAALILWLHAGAPAVAATPIADRMPPIGAGYVPKDDDERGLWMKLDGVERETRTSDFLVRDPALNAYVQGVLCRTVGSAACGSLRLYIVRVASFNASMAPNGMVLVHTGLLLRMRSEAQLAAILGHEFTHFARRHSLQKFRDRKTKQGRLAVLAAAPVSDRRTALVIRLAQILTVGSQYSFSREKEREADAGSIPLMVAAGYDPANAAPIWQGLVEEEAASEAARHRRVRLRESSFDATHPSDPERVAALSAAARPFAGRSFASDGAAAYRSMMRPWWPQLIDDEIKLNDLGRSDWLLGRLAADGWTPALLYARGELYRTRGRTADLARAAAYYRQAIQGDAPVEAWRGLGLVLARSGKAAEGRRALETYLMRKPDATDRAMIAMLAGER